MNRSSPEIIYVQYFLSSQNDALFSMRFSVFIALLAVAAVVLVWRSGWTPFPPRDYEECAENAAKSAKSKEALGVLVSSCASKFVGRLNVRGGYSYYDGRQNREFNIVGPNSSKEEW